MKFFELSCSHGASLTCYILDERPIRNQNRTPRPGIIIVPGGGYHRLVDHEQECVAVQFVSKGYHTFILNYSVNEDGKKPLSSIPLEQLASAVALLRKSSKEWDLDPECIAVVGFSAGGHLAGSLAVHWDKEWLFRRTGLSSELIKPNALILAYPVIVGSGSSLPHRKNSIDYLLGDDASEEERYTYSLEKHVGRHVAPVFLWHTIEDECAPVEASMLFANACICAKVPLELHIFPKNQHGLSLASKETAWNDNSEDAHIAHWLMLCDEWLNIIWKEKNINGKVIDRR